MFGSHQRVVASSICLVLRLQLEEEVPTTSHRDHMKRCISVLRLIGMERACASGYRYLDGPIMQSRQQPGYTTATNHHIITTYIEWCCPMCTERIRQKRRLSEIHDIEIARTRVQKDVLNPKAVGV